MIFNTVSSGHIEICADQAVHAQRGDLRDLIDVLVEETLRLVEAESAGVQDQARAHDGAAGETAAR